MNEQAMIEYIKQEPEILRNIYLNKDKYCKEFVEHFKHHNVKRVYISGNGSAYNAGVIIRYMMEKVLKVEASVDYPSMFNNHCNYNANGIYKPDEMLLICPAQTGRTRGPVYAARKAKQMGIPVVCTTLLSDGILAKACDIVIDKETGPEESFAETKGHLATIGILILCVAEAAYALGRISDEEYQHYMTSFASLPDSCSDAIEATEKWYAENKDTLLHADYLTFLGFGANYATAVEGGLKILETTLKPCVSYECEEYMHGQNQPVGKDSVIFFLCPKEAEQDRMHDLIEWCRDYSENCFLISSPDDAHTDSKGLKARFTECEFLTGIEYLIPFQVLSYLMARDMGLSTVVANHDDAGKELNVRFES